MKYKLKNNEEFEVTRDDRTVNILNVSENIIMEFTASAKEMANNTYALNSDTTWDDIEEALSAGNNVVAIVPVSDAMKIPVTLNLIYIPDGNNGWIAGTNIWGFSFFDKKGGIRFDWDSSEQTAVATRFTP